MNPHPLDPRYTLFGPSQGPTSTHAHNSNSSMVKTRRLGRIHRHRTVKAEDPTEIDLTQSDDDTEQDRKLAPEERAKEQRPQRQQIKSETAVLIEDSDSDEPEVLLVARLPQESLGTGRRRRHHERDKHMGSLALATQLASGHDQVLPSQKRPRGPPFSCSICLEDHLASFKGYSINACLHKFCIHCLVQLLQTQVNEASSGSTCLFLRCPHEGCNSRLTTEDVQDLLRLLPDRNQACSLWKRYTEIANLSALEAQVTDDTSETRRCPSEHCNYLFQFAPGTGTEGRHFSCPLCADEYCLNCGANNGLVGPAHPTQTCYERTEQLRHEVEERRKFQDWQHQNAKADEHFQALLNTEARAGITQPCPNCRTPITKNGGCSHMRCTRCRTDFTWKGRTTRGW